MSATRSYLILFLTVFMTGCGHMFCNDAKRTIATFETCMNSNGCRTDIYDARAYVRAKKDLLKYCKETEYGFYR